MILRASFKLPADGERTLIDGHFDLRRIARQIIKAMDFSASRRDVLTEFLSYRVQQIKGRGANVIRDDSLFTVAIYFRPWRLLDRYTKALFMRSAWL